MAIKILGKNNHKASAPHNDIQQRLINACMTIFVGSTAEKAANANNMAQAIGAAMAQQGLGLIIATDVRTLSQDYFMPDGENIKQDGAPTNDQRVAAIIAQFAQTAVEKTTESGLIAITRKQAPAISKTPGEHVKLSLSIYAPGISLMEQERSRIKATAN